MRRGIYAALLVVLLASAGWAWPVGDPTGSGITASSVTYAELLALQTAGTLTPGQQYRITDFRTYHKIPNTTAYNTGPTEVLIVTASTASTLSHIAQSESYPQDILYYELVQSHMWGEVLIDGGDRGWIYYREDTLKANKLDYDFRHVKWRRWNSQADGLGTWTVLTDNTFPYQDFVTFQVYNALTTDGNDFSSIAGKGTQGEGPNFNNVFFGASNGNISRGKFKNNTFLGSSRSNDFGIAFVSNILAEGFNYNKLRDAFTGCTTQASFVDNTVVIDFYDYTFPATQIRSSHIGGPNLISGSNWPAIKIWQPDLLDVPVAGSIEYADGGPYFYGTVAVAGGTRYTFAFLESPQFVTPNIGYATAAGLNIDGEITSMSNIVLAGTTSVVRLKGYTVATLPVGTQGDTAFVTDALAPTFLGVIAGGGTVVTPVFFNGTNWIAH